MKNKFCMVSLLFIILSSCMIPDPPAANPGFQGQIVFTSAGSEFSPIITVDASRNPEILWTFADGTTDDSAAPSKDYGSNAERENILQVRPWSAVTGINIGYDAGDGGDMYDDGEDHGEIFDPVSLHSDQAVTGVSGLDPVSQSLRCWSSSGSSNIIPVLDFSGFQELERIECMGAQIGGIILDDTPSLKRLCLEGARLSADLDLTECENLMDFRGAGNLYDQIIFGADEYPDLWHICINTNPQLTVSTLFEDMSKFPAVEEFLVWTTNQEGSFALTSTSADWVTIFIGYNLYTSVDFRGSLRNEMGGASIEISGNPIEDIFLDECDQLRYLYASDCGIDQIDLADCYQLEGLTLNSNQFTSLDVSGFSLLGSLEMQNNLLETSALDSILTDLDLSGRENGTVDLRGNPGLPSPGLPAAANLQAKGWTVLTGPMPAP